MIRENPTTIEKYWFIIHNNDSLVIKKNDTLPKEDDISSILSLFIRQFYLGQIEGHEYFCAEIDNRTSIPSEFKTTSLRQTLSLLYPHHYAMGVKAYSIIHWDKNHHFCGRCGAETIHPSKHFERMCSVCNLSFFPRISPSIIVLIHNDDHLVMARSPHFPPEVYGFIAGFVEVGETLEEAIHREVQEEVGLKIKNIAYFGSQPWPFPDSLMIAFTAEYDTGEIVIDNHEIEKAGWYRYDNLPGKPSTAISIASELLENFIYLCTEKKKKKYTENIQKLSDTSSLDEL